MKVGIIGAGFMAERMSKTLQHMEGFELYAIASSSREKAERFVKEFGWQKTYQVYEDLMNDPEVELVYIAQPTRFHPSLTKQAILHKKPVLCEKPICINEEQTRELVELARKEKVFLAEALWTNFQPSRKLIDDVLQSGELGDLIDVDIYFRNNVSVLHADRFDDPGMGAGALMEMGSYTIGACMLSHLGYEGVHLVDTQIEWLPSGLDKVSRLVYEYDNGLKVKIVNDVACPVPEKYYQFNGTRAVLRVEGTSNPQKIQVLGLDGELIRDIPVPAQITGYEYQWEGCKRAIEAGKLEPDEVPLDEVLASIHKMDEVRQTIGLRFPFE